MDDSTISTKLRKTMEASARLTGFIHISRSTLDEPEHCSDHQMSSSAYPTRTANCGARKSNKRKQQRAETHVMVENDLLQLCRAKEWAHVIRRSRSNPEEAVPKQVAERHTPDGLDANSTKLGMNGKFFDFDENEIIYYDTPLGVACASNELETDTLQEVIVALVMACPRQVRASQLNPGHTPLRDAILNPRCGPLVLRALLDAEVICQKCDGGGSSVLGKKDRYGYRPVDHLITRLQIGSSNRSIDVFKQYVGHELFQVPLGGDKDDIECSPLIRLLSARLLPGQATTEDGAWLATLLECSELLLERDASTFTTMSKMTGCSPIHVALRNYGNYAGLIRMLISRPGSNELMAHRNCFGDLPLHVACSVGVSFDVLKTIINATVDTTRVEKATSLGMHPLLWSANHLGYTAADLIWIRHIEGGQSLDTPRSSYPMELSAAKRCCIKQHEYYQGLLREAVDHFLKEKSRTPSCSVENAFGTLVDRMSLLVTSASHLFPSSVGLTPLHNICKLASPVAPPLLGPLVHLFFSLYEQDMLSRDQYGMIPLHYLVSSRGREASQVDVGNWTNHVLQYLKLEPMAVRVATGEGRLPLHLLLDHPTHQDLIQEVLACFPESIDSPDPETGLAPFQLAASNQNTSLDVIFLLLRQSPSRCSTADSQA
jgi:hypothetical protein